MKKFVGIFLIAFVFIFLFTMTALQNGLLVALAEWATAIVLAAITFFGMWLMDK